ncbi:DUF4197 domain-containing protein [Flavobacterium agricola]|uniref:DUF4197 domain-containing protein n=1 Tax=Flavobacterium agricola TaxID=2870839 RepID=A0ABY6M2D2_9FLAO|nr:DUF4197 domain-containing protein [Flavobacterium agricola]UYW01423.1 DUF4197 domain-containing protein [Flavobacterium agricola]
MKKTAITCLLVSFLLSACGGLQEVINQASQQTTQTQIGQTQIANGLKEALQLGVSKQVSELTTNNGFYANELVRITLPEELQQVEKTLRSVGLGSLADQGIKALNETASQAVKEATPIFVQAISNLTITDAKQILMGANNAATQYLEKQTANQLYDKFSPIIQESFTKVGADKVWAELITTYNQIPLVKKVNPDLTNYVTQQAMNGVYTMIEQEEVDIRTNVANRSTILLKSVFALQDNK